MARALTWWGGGIAVLALGAVVGCEGAGTATATPTADPVATATLPVIAAPAATATQAATPTSMPAPTAAPPATPTSTATATPRTIATTPAPPTGTAPVAAPAPAPVAAPALPEVTSPKVAEATYSVWMSGAGRYRAGQPGTVQVVLVPKGEWHCNESYPYKLKLGAPPAGVSYPAPVVRKDAMSVTPQRASMAVPFVPASVGEARITGTFSFSVCSAASCQVESRELAITVKVD